MRSNAGIIKMHNRKLSAQSLSFCLPGLVLVCSSVLIAQIQVDMRADGPAGQAPSIRYGEIQTQVQTRLLPSEVRYNRSTSGMLPSEYRYTVHSSSRLPSQGPPPNIGQPTSQRLTSQTTTGGAPNFQDVQRHYDRIGANASYNTPSLRYSPSTRIDTYVQPDHNFKPPSAPGMP